MSEKTEETAKKTVVVHWAASRKFMMSATEYTGVVVGKEATDSEYVISDGVIAPNGFIPDHYHLWEDQTFHIIEGQLEAKIGNEVLHISTGDSIHCPRGVSHYMKNIGHKEARLISYIFPGDWAEEFMAETSRQNSSGKHDRKLIEEKFGVIYR
ncbi:MAG: cupin domain-containing protein [Nitratireductor sp.]